jgi:hypothetical protein
MTQLNHEHFGHSRCGTLQLDGVEYDISNLISPPRSKTKFITPSYPARSDLISDHTRKTLSSRYERTSLTEDEDILRGEQQHSTDVSELTISKLSETNISPNNVAHLWSEESLGNPPTLPPTRGHVDKEGSIVPPLPSFYEDDSTLASWSTLGIDHSDARSMDSELSSVPELQERGERWSNNIKDSVPAPPMMQLRRGSITSSESSSSHSSSLISSRFTPQQVYNDPPAKKDTIMTLPNRFASLELPEHVTYGKEKVLIPAKKCSPPKFNEQETKETYKRLLSPHQRRQMFPPQRNGDEASLSGPSVSGLQLPPSFERKPSTEYSKPGAYFSPAPQSDLYSTPDVKPGAYRSPTSHEYARPGAYSSYGNDSYKSTTPREDSRPGAYNSYQNDIYKKPSTTTSYHNDNNHRSSTAIYEAPLRSRPAAPAPSSADKRPNIEVSPGIMEPLRGAKETLEAADMGRIRRISCVCCTHQCYCIVDAKYMYCPVCRVLSPVEGGEWGVGMGFDLQDLYSQDERPAPRQAQPPKSRRGLAISLINQQQQR